jgi:hypothetical protein
MDYGRRKYASPSDCQKGFTSEVTDQYVNSVGGDTYPHADWRQPYTQKNYQEMMYLFNDLGTSPYLNDQKGAILDPFYTSDPPLGTMPHIGTPIPGSPQPWDIPGTRFPGGDYMPSTNWGQGGGGAATGDGDVSATVGGGTGGAPSWYDLCGSMGIRYTTYSMGADETMAIGASSTSGDVNFEWHMSGPGTLTNPNGGSITGGYSSVIYTAPHSNPDCEPTMITLECEGRATNVIKIMVNTAVPGVAFTICCCYGPIPPSQPYTYSCLSNLRCNSTYESMGACACATNSAGLVQQSSVGACCTAYGIGSVDVRTEEMKANGCCPSQLL